MSSISTRRAGLEADEMAADVHAASRVSAAFTLFAAIGGVALLLGDMEPKHVEAYWAGVVLAVLGPPLYLLVPWARLGPRALLLATNVPGVLLTAEAVWNSGGTGSPYVVYFSALVVVSALYATRAQLRGLVVIVFAAALLPLTYEETNAATTIVHAVFVVGLSASIAALLHASRERGRRMAASLAELASRDSLTGAWNRRELLERGRRELARAGRVGAPTTVLYLDLDGFKGVNDRHGHAAGDQLLIDVVVAARASLRTADVLARPGGDEFAVLLPDTTSAEGAAVAARLAEDIEAAVLARGVSVSVGAASAPDDGVEIEALLTVADRRMLERKDARGRARPAFTAG